MQLVGKGRQKTVVRCDGIVSGVEQREAAGPIGRFHHARFKTGLADGGGLLISHHAQHRHGVAKKSRVGETEIRPAVADFGQQTGRDIQQGQHVLVPLAGMDVAQHGARGIGGVGLVFAPAGQMPQQKGIDRAEGQFTACGPGAGIGHVVQNPGDFGAGEIGIEQQAGALAHQRFVAVLLELLAEGCGAAVLPDNRAIDRGSGFAVPQNCGFALVGDPDTGEIFGSDIVAGQHGFADFERGLQQIIRFVFDPTRGRIMLGEIALRAVDHI